jgi:hypothetical protein
MINDKEEKKTVEVMPANIIQRLKDECLSSDQILESIEKIMKEKSK